ncbi:Kelch repeat-containing protein [Anaerovorax odorimutans]|uniref:Kelch repeat-containing protein n=1 Tax=Anaerovorax odorimutans TaxID=109327 RepID=UPI00040320C6|nr:Ig-like domain-containing protein [Anaerovorax odorimutans]
MKRILTIFITLCMVLSISGVSAWADEETGWQVESQTPRFGIFFGIASDSEQIYMIGGYTNAGASQEMDIYNVKTRTWKSAKPIPIKQTMLSCTMNDEKIYAFGYDNKDIMQIYDTKSNTWTTNSAITDGTPVQVASVGNKIYLINNDFHTKTSDTMNIYNTETGIWTKGKSIPTQKYGAGIVAVGSRIYVIGGQVQSNIVNTVDIYDTVTDTWSSGAPMPSPRCQHSLAATDTKIYAMAGSSSNGSFLDLVNTYDVSTDSWTSCAQLLEKRTNAISTIVNGKLYLMGGNKRESDNGYTVLMESLKIGDSVSTDKKLSVLLNTGETVQLSVSYNLTDNTNFTWSSTNEAVATVDANGKVTAVGEGHADIYAENADGTFKEYIPVKVVEGTADEMRLAVHLKAGDNSNLYLADDPSLVTWSSMDESIATVSASGEVTAVKKGLAIIQGQLEGQTYQIYVRVNG